MTQDCADGCSDRGAGAGTSAAAEPGPGTPVPSPCNSVCRMDADGRYCIGCFRTLDEIAGWAAFDDGRRRLIWQQLPLRRAACERCS
jgi:hypothetical protein